MSKETDSEDEIKKELSEDYYAGYYWGNQPYRSSEVPGRKSDEDLANDVLVRLRTLGFSKVQVRVANGAAILTGKVQDYLEKRNAGVEAWKIPGIVEVSNNLQIMSADTEGLAA
jgi:hypothetical protein